ncbi:MAG: endonuclease NucS [Candidatus Brocadiia bacterium]
MPVEVAIWKLGERVDRVGFEPMPSETQLEDILAEDISIIDPNLLLIGRQVLTGYGNYMDLLAMDADANLVVIELKRDRTPREVVAQLLDYGSWVRHLEDTDIASLFDDYVREHYPQDADTSLDQAFCEKFGVREMPEILNESHELVVVASELDASTERIVNYLADEYGVAVNAVFFRFFRDGGNEYLSRVWLIDPGEVEAKVVERRQKGPWNGEFYVSFGIYANQKWDDAVKYGFVSASGGTWYTKTLEMLDSGERIWVNVPGEGYTGVGEVTGTVVTVDQFMVEGENGREVPITEMPVEAPKMFEGIGNPEQVLHMVPVRWIKTVPLSEAIHEKGFFGNQNTVARPRSKKWDHTVERLKTRFGVEQSTTE